MPPSTHAPVPAKQAGFDHGASGTPAPQSVPTPSENQAARDKDREHISISLRQLGFNDSSSNGFRVKNLT